jgi:AraC-like DNA-binding protein
VWTLEGDARELADMQPVLPDGRPEIVLHRGDPFDRIESGVAQRQPAVIFAGQLLGPLTLRPTGVVAVIGIRLQPYGAAAFFDMPQEDLVGSTMAVDTLSTRLARELEELRARADSVDAVAHAVRRWLERRVDDSGLDRRVEASVRSIRDSRGLVRVDDLARQLGITARHLERRFKRIVGVSPKQLARITRFQCALQVLERVDSPQRGTHAATMSGYADQAHFIRDFRQMAGCPPGAHLLRQTELNGFFAGTLTATRP